MGKRGKKVFITFREIDRKVICSMPIKRISSSDPRWLEFINTRPESNAFHHPYWLINLEDSYQYQTFIIVLENEQQQIIAGVPMAEVNSILTGRRWVSLPFSDYCPPLAENEQALNDLTDGLIKISLDTKSPKIELRWEYPTRPEIIPTYENVYHIGHFCKATEKETFMQFRYSNRRYILKTLESGVHIEMGTSEEFVERFYDLHCYTRRRLGMPVQPWNYFKNLGKNVLEKGLGKIILAFADGNCIAGNVFLHYQKKLIVKYRASGKVNLTKVHPNYLLDWEAIKWGCANGYDTFEHGRCDIDDESLRQYKNQWGYKEKPLTYSYIGSNPEKKSELFGVMNLIIRRSPIWVCRTAGELLYRHVG